VPRRSQVIVRTALFLALAVILPIAFHQFGMAGRIFSPMHIPALLAGFVSGPISGVIVGLLGPGLSFALTGMPPAYAVPLMTLELMLYGLAAGLTFRNLRMNIYLSLIISMIAGRIGFAVGLLLMGLVIQLPYGVNEYLKIAFVTGLPGILIQLVVIPPIVMAVRRRYN
jgi:hypothetical protein